MDVALRGKCVQLCWRDAPRVRRVRMQVIYGYIDNVHDYPCQGGFGQRDLGEGETVMGRLAPGELGDYVLEGEAGQELQVALRSQFSNAILSVYGLTDGQVLVSVTEFKARFTGILPSSQSLDEVLIGIGWVELDDLEVAAMLAAPLSDSLGHVGLASPRRPLKDHLSLVLQPVNDLL